MVALFVLPNTVIKPNSVRLLPGGLEPRYFGAGLGFWRDRASKSPTELGFARRCGPGKSLSGRAAVTHLSSSGSLSQQGA
jgi:hypothetical protein